jgi:hypothetical protein
MKRLLIVGNGDIERDLTDDVERAAIVVRFNLCRNYGKNTGKKADLLCVVNWGWSGKKFAAERKLQELECINSIKQLIFPLSKRILDLPDGLVCRLIRLAHAHPSLFRDLLRLGEFGNEIILNNHIADRDIVYVHSAIRRQLYRKLRTKRNLSGIVAPSTGMIIIEYFLNSTAWSEYEKSICGFSHEGWWGHPWEAEKALIDEYRHAGILRVLDR